MNEQNLLVFGGSKISAEILDLQTLKETEDLEIKLIAQNIN